MKATKSLRTCGAAIGLALLLQTTGSLVLGPLADADTTMAATTRVHVREKASTSSKSLAILKPGQEVKAKGTSSSGWTEVTYNGKKAYVFGKYLSGKNASSAVQSSAAKGTAYTTTNLNIRKGPNTSYAKVAVAPKGTKMELTGKISGAFTQVRWKGAEQWAASTYLTTTKPTSSTKLPKVTGRGKATTALMIRTTSTASYKSLGDVPRGTILELTGKIENGMAQVIWQGNVRWVNNRYLTGVDEVSSAPKPNTLPKTSQRYATADLNVWAKSSGQDYSTVIPKGSTLEVTGTIENGRAQIVFNGALKWVTSQYTSVSAPAPDSPASNETPDTSSETTRFATALLNIWEASSGTTYSGQIKKGDSFEITGVQENGRLQISHNGELRWVTAQYTSTTAPPASSAGGAPAREGINKGWSSGLDKSNADVQRIAWYVWDNFPQIKTQYGWRKDVTPDHPGGRAVDVMIPNWKTDNALGYEIALFFKDNATEFNIKYIIWDQKIWSVARNSEGWRKMADRGGDTANHLDHVHINTY